MPDFHSLSDSSTYVTDDDQWQEVHAFERQYGRLFRWFLTPPQAFVNHHSHEQDLLSYRVEQPTFKTQNQKSTGSPLPERARCN